MKKSVLSLVVAVALLVPQAGMHAQEPVTEQKKELSSWTGGFLSSLGKAIKKREYKKLPSIVAKYKKTAAGIGALLVLGVVKVVVQLFAPEAEVPRTPSEVIRLPFIGAAASVQAAEKKRAEELEQQKDAAMSAAEWRQKIVPGAQPGQMGGQPSAGFRIPGQR